MPVTAALLEDALAKKGGLTLSQLVNYDDLLTDALVDKVYYWTQIRKLRPGYHASRGVREEDVTRILQKHVILDRNLATGINELLRLPGLSRYHNALKTKDEKEHFARHLRKYVSIYLPDCAFEVCSTNRYTVISHEASTIARKPIKKGEVIKYLSGIQVAMTKTEELELDLKNRDFSIVMSSRKKTPSLFLGPARFANHDCNANARLSTVGPHGMQIVCVRNMDIGDEITVTYGDDYFGEDNCECLCATCERLQRNGFGRQIRSDSTPRVSPAPGPEEHVTPHSLRRKRKLNFDPETHSPSLTPESTSPGPAKRQKLSSPAAQRISKSAAKGSSSLKSVAFPGDNDVVEASRATHNLPKLNKYRMLTQLSMTTSDSETGRSTSPMSSVMEGSQLSSTSTSATSMDDTIKVKPLEDLSSELSELSELPDNCELDDATQQIVACKKKRTKEPTRQSLRNRPSLPSLTIERMDEADRDSSSACSSSSDDALLRRRPGDWSLTRRLLAHIYSRWVECRTCDDYFVQDDACQTRADCPRCERHSKLYGYAWPKTDKDGRNDREERILDHRTVHRFVDPGTEKSLKKGRRTLESLVAYRVREARESVDTEALEPGRRMSRRLTS